MFAPEEVGWRRVGNVWARAASGLAAAPIRLRVDESRIDGAGKGLFATSDMEDGHRLGRMHGAVVFRGSSDECEDWANGRGELYCVLLSFEGAHAVVDVSGTPFALLNHSVSPNVHVRMNGQVELCEDVTEGDELCWDYGSLYGVS